MSIFQRSALLVSIAVLGIAACDSGNDTTTEAPAENVGTSPEELEPQTEYPAVGSEHTDTDLVTGEDNVPARTEPANRPLPYPEGVTREMVRQGQTLFTSTGNCYRCHEENGTGSALAPDLTDAVWLHLSGANYEEIVALEKSGVPQPKEHPVPMPPRGGADLTEQQVRAIAAFVYSLSTGTED